jgi:hypothetical protein
MRKANAIDCHPDLFVADADAQPSWEYYRRENL